MYTCTIANQYMYAYTYVYTHANKYDGRGDHERYIMSSQSIANFNVCARNTIAIFAYAYILRNVTLHHRYP